MDDDVSRLPRDARGPFRALLEKPAADLPTLRRQVEAYREHVHEHYRENEFIDIVLVDALADASLVLLDKMIADGEAVDAREQLLAQAAVRYFVETEDGDHDLATPIGFEDDAQVMRMVLEALAMDVSF